LAFNHYVFHKWVKVGIMDRYAKSRSCFMLRGTQITMLFVRKNVDIEELNLSFREKQKS
jgi:hypothetical protein